MRIITKTRNPINKLESTYNHLIKEFAQQLLIENIESFYQTDDVNLQSILELMLDIPIDVDLPPGASQVYSLTPVQTGTHKIFTGPYGGTGSSNDTVLELFSDENLTNRIAYNDDANGTLFSDIRLSLTAGVTYYVKLRHYSASGAVHARLTAAYYIPPPVITLDSPIDVDIPQGKYKVFKFAPANLDYYRIFTGYFGGSSSSGYSDTMIYLYSDENLTKQIGFNDDYNGTLFSELKRELAGGTSYYIKLVGYNGQSVHARITVTQATRNFVELQTNNPIDVSLPAYEFGYYKFTPSLSGNYRFYTGPYGGTGGQSDTVLYLYSDANLLNRLAYNDDSNNTLFSEIKWELQAGTTYYIKLGGYAGGSIQARLAVEPLYSFYEYEYDDDNQLIKIIEHGIPIFELIYDGNGNLLSKRNPNI